MLEFSFEALEESAVAFRRIEAFLNRATELIGKEPEAKYSTEFKTAMDNDLAVPEAIASISESMKQGNNAITSNDLKALEKHASEVRGALSILGCDPFDPVFKSGSSNKKELLDGLVSLALEQRTAARDRKDFATSDAIRDELAKLGVVIEDTAQGVRWSVN
jgi:cysteinyl-tRNA synthetase